MHRHPLQDVMWSCLSCKGLWPCLLLSPWPSGWWVVPARMASIRPGAFLQDGEYPARRFLAVQLVLAMRSDVCVNTRKSHTRTCRLMPRLQRATIATLSGPSVAVFGGGCDDVSAGDTRTSWSVLSLHGEAHEALGRAGEPPVEVPRHDAESWHPLRVS